MGIITRMRKQKAVYWPKSFPNKYGESTVAPPVEILVRWEDTVMKVTNFAGKEVMTKSIVYVPQLLSGDEVTVGGHLFLGELTGAPSNPVSNPYCYEIIRFDNVPDIRAKEFLRTAYV